MKRLGAGFKLEGKILTVDGRGVFSADSTELDCSESGSTLRFIIPVAAAGGVKSVFTGHGKLPVISVPSSSQGFCLLFRLLRATVRSD